MQQKFTNIFSDNRKQLFWGQVEQLKIYQHAYNLWPRNFTVNYTCNYGATTQISYFLDYQTCRYKINKLKQALSMIKSIHPKNIKQIAG